MNMYKRVGVAALGLVALLSMPIEAQRGQAPAQSRQAQQEQRDIEFLQLRDDIGFLEDILKKNPPKDAIDNDGAREEITESGSKWINQDFAPSNVADVIERTFYNRATELVSRYGLKIPAESSIFTSGNSIIVGVPYSFMVGPFKPPIKNYLIIDEFSLISTTAIIGGGEVFDPYQRYVSLPTGKGFEIQSFPEVSKGLIPFFKEGDFPEISEKIREYYNASRSSLRWGYGNHHPRVQFPAHQLYNIAKMLAEAINYDLDIAVADVISKNNYLSNIMTSLIGGGRIIVDTHTSSLNLEGGYGRMSLSIGPKGDVKFWWAPETIVADRGEFQDKKIVLGGPRVYADVKIKFPISP